MYLLIQTRKLANNIKVMGQNETDSVAYHENEGEGDIQIEGTYFYIGYKQQAEKAWICPREFMKM